MNEDIQIVMGVVMLLLGTVIVGVLIGTTLASKSCFERFEDYSPKYSLFGGCRIEFEGKFTPVNNIRFADFK